MDGKTPVSQLHEYLMQNSLAMPRHEIKRHDGGDSFICKMYINMRKVVLGYGPSKQSAKHDCARRALHVLRNQRGEHNRETAVDVLHVLALDLKKRQPVYSYYKDYNYYEVECKFSQFTTFGSAQSMHRAKEVATVQMLKKFGISTENREYERPSKESPRSSKERITGPKKLKNLTPTKESQADGVYSGNGEIYNSFDQFISLVPKEVYAKPFDAQMALTQLAQLDKSVKSPCASPLPSLLDEPNRPLLFCSRESKILQPQPSEFTSFETFIGRNATKKVPELLPTPSNTKMICGHDHSERNAVEIDDIRSMEKIFADMKIAFKWNLEGQFNFPNGCKKTISFQETDFHKLCSNLFESMLRRE